MNSARIKRRYLDFRFGQQTIGPVLQISNFMMLAYLTINEYISIWVFAPLFVITILITHTIIGNKFRHHQQPTDLNLGYEKSTQAGKTVHIWMESNKKIMDKLNIPYPDGFEERLEYMRKIGNGEL